MAEGIDTLPGILLTKPKASQALKTTRTEANSSVDFDSKGVDDEQGQKPLPDTVMYVQLRRTALALDWCFAWC